MQKNSYKKREHYWHRRALKNSLGGKILKKCCIPTVLKYWITQRLEVSGFWNGICMLFSLRAMELSMHYCERLYGGNAIRRLLWHAYALFKKTGDIRYSRLRHARTVSGTRFAGCVQNCRRIRHQRLCRDQPADARPLTKRHSLQGCRDAHE